MSAEEIHEINDHLAQIDVSTAVLAETLKTHGDTLSALQKNVQVLNDAHVKNESDHATLIAGQRHQDEQWKTIVKIIGLSLSTLTVLFTVINFALEHVYR